MRLLINVPDSTRPEVKARLTRLAERLNEDPELVEELDLGEGDDLQRLFTPERMEIIREADSEIEAGHFLTASQVEDRLIQKEAEWKKSRSG